MPRIIEKKKGKWNIFISHCSDPSHLSALPLVTPIHTHMHTPIHTYIRLGTAVGVTDRGLAQGYLNT